MATGSGNPPERKPATAYDRDGLRRLLTELGEGAFRADQVRQGLYARPVAGWSRIKGLSRSLAERLAATLPLHSSRIAHHSTSPDGSTKLALELADRQIVEAVVIPTAGRNTLCLSTQAGCLVGCTFCASGLGGLVRNLTSWELVEQLCHASCLIGGPIHRLVVMGVGEPLYNLEGLLPALARVQEEDTFNIGSRRITVSTAGVIPGIEELSRRRPAVHLAISLHAADQSLRESLVPLARTCTVTELVAAAAAYQKSTGRQVTFEVVLLRQVNDSPAEARALVELLRGGGYHVNLIPYNPVAEMPFQRPEKRRIERFAQILESGGIANTVRRSRGGTDSAACGQLRNTRG